MRMKLKRGERSSKYSPGQFVSQEYAARYPGKVTRVRKKKAKAPPQEKKKKVTVLRHVEEPESDFWEVTVYYGEE